MEPEKSHMEEEKHLQTMNFQVPCWFSGVYKYVLYIYLLRQCFCKQFGKFIVANYINRVLNFNSGGLFCVLLQVFCLPRAALINRGPSKNHPIVNPTMLVKDAS